MPLGRSGAHLVGRPRRTPPTPPIPKMLYKVLAAAFLVANADALKINNTVTELILFNNQLGHEAGVALAEALEINKTVTELYLGDNQLNDKAKDALLKAKGAREGLLLYLW